RPNGQAQRTFQTEFDDQARYKQFGRDQRQQGDQFQILVARIKNRRQHERAGEQAQHDESAQENRAKRADERSFVSFYQARTKPQRYRSNEQGSNQDNDDERYGEHNTRFAFRGIMGGQRRGLPTPLLQCPIRPFPDERPLGSRLRRVTTGYLDTDASTLSI